MENSQLSQQTVGGTDWGWKDAGREDMERDRKEEEHRLPVCGQIEPAPLPCGREEKLYTPLKK